MLSKNIVLLHGWGAETKKLEPLKNELEKLGWIVLLPKLAGFEKPAPKVIWGLKEYSEYAFKETKKKFGKDSFFLFGHSFGGGIAIKLASVSPENLQGVILCATRGISRRSGVKRIIFAVLAKTGKILLVTPQLAMVFRKLLYKAAREHDYYKAQGIMREVFKKIISEDLKPLIHKIKVPVLILWGNRDKMTPVTDAYHIKSLCSQSELVTYKDQGHRLPYDVPKLLAKEIDRWYTKLY